MGFLGMIAYDLAKEGLKGIIDYNNKIINEKEILARLKKQQESNQEARKLYIDNSIISPNNNLLCDSHQQLLLTGESSVVSKNEIQNNVSTSSFYNTVISGGEDDVRALAVTRFCENAYRNHLPFILIHNNNRNIENMLQNSLIRNNVILVNSSNGAYDPFIGLSRNEMLQRFTQTAPEHIRNNASVSVLFNIVSELYSIRNNNKNIPLRLLMAYDANELVDKIQDTRKRGLIDDRKMIELNRKLNSSQSEVPLFQDYLYNLRDKFESFYKKNRNNNFVGFGSSLTQNKCVAVSISNETNIEMIKMLLSTLNQIKQRNVNFVSCIIDIPLSLHNYTFYNYLNSECNKFIVSSKDICSSLGSRDKLNSLMGYAPTKVYFRHSDSSNALALSEGLGTYSRWNVSYNASTANRGLIPDVTNGISTTQDHSAKKVPPEVLESISGYQACYKPGDSDKIYIMNLS